MADTGSMILKLWRRLHAWPAGKWLFAMAIGRMVPYSGSIGARVEKLEPGDVVILLPDRKRVRNHLRSIHAVALTNLGELASGLAFLTTFPPGLRSIVVELTTEYRKKARGTLTATAHAEPPAGDRDEERLITAEIRDEEDDIVAIVRARWKVGPRP